MANELDEIRAILDEREKSVNQRFAAQKEAVGAALTAAKEAVDKAEKAQERRLDLLNEFRAQAADESVKYATKEALSTANEKINKLETALARVTVGGGLMALGVVTVIVKLFFP